MKTSAEGRMLIRQFEGLRKQAYICPAGVPTIGFGRTKGVKLGMSCTEQQAQVWLTEDLEEAEADVESLVTVPLNSNQHAALVSLFYNLGRTKLASSTLIRKLNAGDYIGASQQFKLWRLVSGKPSNGLVRRRAAETDLFLKEIA